jgi:hypothetical protein
LSTENGFKIGPLALNCYQELKGLCDLSNIILPKIYFIIELLVIRRTLLIAEHNDMIFDYTIYVVSTGNLIILFKVGLALELLYFKICFRGLLPNSANLLELNFNFKLLAGIISELGDLLTIVVET